MDVEAVVAAHREEWARIVAALTRRFADLDLAQVMLAAVGIAAVGLAAIGAAAMALFHRGNSVSQEDEAEARELVQEELRGAPVERPHDKGSA